MIDETVILQRVRDNDDQAFSLLSDKYSRLVSSLVNSFSHEDATREDIEDMTQEAQVLLYKAARTYSADSGLSFGLYARTCIRNGLISLERKRKREIKRVNLEISEFDLPGPDTTDRIDEADAASVLMQKIEDMLSPLELDVFICLTLDYKHTDICKKLGITAKAAENAVYRIKKKLGTLLF